MLIALQFALGMGDYVKFLSFVACMLTYQLIHAACDVGWDPLPTASDDCYKVFNETMYENAYFARKTCLDEGADMASIVDSVTEAGLVAQIMTMSPVPKQIYIGLTDIESESNFTWLDNTTSAFHRWSTSEPNDWAGFGGEDCVAMRSSDQLWDFNDADQTFWNDVPCGFNAHDVTGVVCKKPQSGAPISVPTSEDIVYQYIYGDCADGWRACNRDCFKLVNGTELLANISSSKLNTTYAAHEVCELYGGSIPAVEDAEILRCFAEVVRKIPEADRPAQFYVSNDDIITEGDYTNVWGIATNFTQWGPAGPDTTAGYDCSVAMTTDSWNSYQALDSELATGPCCGVPEFEHVMCRIPMNGTMSVAMNDNPYYHECIDECDSSPCENGATCEDDYKGWSCNCIAGYTGVMCETMINFCEPYPCNNDTINYGGTCSPILNSYTCSCPVEWNGNDCENLIDPCYSDPCQNNGTCGNNVADYTCSCIVGFTSVHCETNIDDCANVTCENGGTCQDLVDDYQCNCVVGYAGDHCETQYSCIPPIPTVHNATILNNTGAFENGLIVYQCNNGQKFDNMDVNKTILCNSGFWSEDLDGAACNDHCDDIPYVANADPGIVNTRVGNTVNYTCDTGYQYSDNSTVKNYTCMPSGNWSTDPKDMEECEIVKCDELPVYPHQHLDTWNNTYNTTVTFWCDVGYQFHDNTTARTIKCLADGGWTAKLPPCEPVKCHKIEPLRHSTCNTTEHTYNTYVECKCKNGKRMRDGATYRIIKCDATAEWSDNVTECDSDRCFPLPYVGNSTPSTTDAIFNTRVVLTCIRGHRFRPELDEAETDEMVCYDNGRWNPILSSCKPLYCPPLEVVAQATPSENNTLFGTVVHYTCDKGHYVYVGGQPNHTVQTTECEADKLWTNKNLQPCLPIQCVPPPPIANSSTEVWDLPAAQDNGMYNYSQQVEYTCLMFGGDQFRFIDGETTRVCECDQWGNWDQTDVSCRKERCDPVIPVTNASPNSYNTSWDTVITYACDEGYIWPPGRFDGKNKTTHHTECQRTGLWNETNMDYLYCDIKNCTSVPLMTNATVNTTRYHYGTVVEYDCDIGFKYPDNETVKFRECSAAPRWEPTDDEWESCEIIHCPELIDVENATRNTNETEYATEVTYTCLNGYQFPNKDKQAMVFCTENETWTEFPEPCEVIFCYPVPEWGPIIFNSTDNEFAATVAYECDEGHAFEDDIIDLDVSEKAQFNSDPRTAYCNKEKRWVPGIGNCIAKESLAKGLVGNTTESEDAVSIGTVACSLMSVLVVGLILLDLNKIWNDLRMMRENIKHAMNKNNKVSDSQTSIAGGESTA